MYKDIRRLSISLLTKKTLFFISIKLLVIIKKVSFGIILFMKSHPIKGMGLSGILIQQSVPLKYSPNSQGE